MLPFELFRLPYSKKRWTTATNFAAITWEKIRQSEMRVRDIEVQIESRQTPSQRSKTIASVWAIFCAIVLHIFISPVALGQHVVSINSDSDLGRYIPIYRIPTGGQPEPISTSVMVQSNLAGTQRYTKLTFEIDRNSSSPPNEDILVRIVAKHNNRPISFETTTLLAAGEMKARTELMVCLEYSSVAFNVNVFHNDSLLTHHRSLVFLSGNNFGNQSANLLSLHSKANPPDFSDSNLDKLFSQANSNNGVWLVNSFDSEWNYGNIEKMPVDFLQLFAFDEIAISVDDFVSLSSDKLNLLEDLLLAGGNLYLYGEKAKERVAEYWLDTTQFKVPSDGSKSGMPVTPVNMSAKAYPSKGAIISEPPVSRLFDEYKVGVGLGTLIIQDATTELSEPISRLGLNTGRLIWESDNDYWEWGLPNVGQTPVLLFLTLSLGFVCVIAPSIMFWSKRHGRRVWLVILMPLSALLATLLLIAFAYLSSSFQSVQRIRSLTILDPRGKGVLWSRQTAFSSKTVSLTVDRNTLVSFIEAPQVPRSSQLRCIYEPDTVTYAGAVPIRTITQIQLIQQVDRGVPLEITPEKDGAMSVKNISGTAIQAGAVFAEDESCYWIDSLADGETKTINIIPSGDAYSKLVAQSDQQMLTSPLAGSTGRSSMFGRSFFPTNHNTSTLLGEDHWQAWLAPPPIIGTWRSKALPKKRFVLFTTESKQVQKLLPDVDPTDSIHLLVGEW